MQAQGAILSHAVATFKVFWSIFSCKIQVQTDSYVEAWLGLLLDQQILFIFDQSSQKL